MDKPLVLEEPCQSPQPMLVKWAENELSRLLNLEREARFAQLRFLTLEEVRALQKVVSQGIEDLRKEQGERIDELNAQNTERARLKREGFDFRTLERKVVELPRQLARIQQRLLQHQELDQRLSWWWDRLTRLE